MGTIRILSEFADLTKHCTASKLLRMNVKAAIEELSKTLGKPKPRAAFGQWVPYAWLVRGLVEKGFGVSTAVNHVLENSGFASNKQAFGSLRASFYKIKDLEWPVSLANVAEKADEEGFE